LQYEGTVITTIEDPTERGAMHQMQTRVRRTRRLPAWVFTPGQICSALGRSRDFTKGLASAVKNNVSVPVAELATMKSKNG
jgi:hypothetical protein